MLASELQINMSLWVATPNASTCYIKRIKRLSIVRKGTDPRRQAVNNERVDVAKKKRVHKHGHTVGVLK